MEVSKGTQNFLKLLECLRVFGHSSVKGHMETQGNVLKSLEAYKNLSNLVIFMYFCASRNEEIRAYIIIFVLVTC